MRVHAADRRDGIGARLVKEFERRAEARGCRTFYPETLSFQGPRLYQELGYRVGPPIPGFTETIVEYIMARERSCEAKDL